MRKALELPCKLWPGGRYSAGYGWDSARRQGAHVSAFVDTFGPVPKGLQVNHHCDEPLCIEPTHLYAGTQAQNLRDQVERGRSRRAQGEAAPTARLSAEQVIAIRARLASGGYGTAAALAREYGVDHSTIRQIRDRRSWTHLPEED